jgi:hypothetical protein
MRAEVRRDGRTGQEADPTLGGDSALRIGYADVREQQVPELGILEMCRNAFAFRRLLSGFPIGFPIGFP